MSDDDKTVYVMESYSQTSKLYSHAFRLIKETEKTLTVADEWDGRKMMKHSLVGWSTDRAEFKRMQEAEIDKRLKRLDEMRAELESSRGKVRVIKPKEPLEKVLVLE